MTKLKNFPRGGIRIQDYKELTQDKPVRNAHIPPICIIPLRQQAGNPAQSLVRPGDTVREGMLIGKAVDDSSINIHSSIPGKVLAIIEITQADGRKSDAVIISLAGEFDKSGKNQEKQNWQAYSPDQLLEKIVDMGIDEPGGMAFPANVKYALWERKRIDYLVVNGVECEPFLTCNYRLIIEKTAAILEAVKIIRKMVNAGQVIIGIEKNKPDVRAEIRKKVTADNLDFKVLPLKVHYPLGDEKQLLKAMLKKEVPAGSVPVDIGIVVVNINTLFAVYEAVVLNKPLFERVITVTGSIVRNPSNLKVRIGTRICEIIEECNGWTEQPVKIIAGSPLMGYAITDLNIPVTGDICGITVLSGKEVRKENKTPCIHCGRCIKVCPTGQHPAWLFRHINYNSYDKINTMALEHCIECGCCSYSCPARLPLVQTIKHGKSLLMVKGR